MPSNPTIIIFDNELAEGNKPVRKFVNHISLAENKCTELEKEEYVNLNESAYLLVNPLVDNKKECEIEDLFLPETLEHKINKLFVEIRVLNLMSITEKKFFQII
ncbi:hypothetical protein [Enterococcus lactis]|uniref:Uncharacterized protein n=1 Tax=Enterococcus lactis TaxID=357441 RepID=A0AAW4QGK6_9ENTE|nr:hypothetical protein [Enterococcus lactis]MBX4193213.1 hypothetical protein [Enterococcus lactis]